MKELENKVALVSSSTRGIGLACAKALAAQGAAVYLGVRRLEAGQQIADELIAAGGRAGVVFFDASREESFSGMVDEVAAKEGRLDILVNNFGSTDVKTDLDVVNGPSEDFFRIVNTNLKSVYLPSKAAVPLMAKNGGGSIINIGSVGGLYPDLEPQRPTASARRPSTSSPRTSPCSMPGRGCGATRCSPASPPPTPR